MNVFHERDCNLSPHPCLLVKGLPGMCFVGHPRPVLSAC